MPLSFRLGHRPSLDGLRGVSILAVVGIHAHLLRSRAGCIGVIVFFVLSGFLITCLLLEEWDRFQSLRLSRFYLRRALRLLPALLVMLAVFVIFQWGFTSRPVAKATTKDALAAVFYSENWVLAWSESFSPGLFGHTWSLSIEEQFYLLWPPSLLFLLRRTSSLTSLACWVGLGIALSAGTRIMLTAAGARLQRVDFGTDCRCDALLFGCAAALVMSSGGRSFSTKTSLCGRWLAYVGAAGLLLLNFGLWFGSEFELGVVYFLVPLLVALVLMEVVRAEGGMLARFLAQPWLAYIGKISYGLYLWHVPLFLQVQAQRWRLPKELAVELLLTIAAVLGSYYLVERPFLRLKNKCARTQDVQVRG